MKKNKMTSISKSKSINELSDFWDNNELSDYKEIIEEVEFEVDINKEGVYFLLEKNLSDKVMNLSKLYKQPANILLNNWVKEKVEAINI
jgi:hypothetical protein